MQDYEIAALLGPAYEDTTPDQRAAVGRAADAIEARYPDPDAREARRDAMAGAMWVILGDDTLEAVATAWRDLRVRERTAHAHLTGALIASGGTEVDLARRAGVTRMTVRKALGK